MHTEPLRVLFVCTGNICRSPIAQRMLEEASNQQNLNLLSASAGTRALNGSPMHPESVRVLADRGIDAGGFSSRLLTPAIARDFDLVLGMTREHRAVARQQAPIRWKRMYALREISEATLTDPTVGLTINSTDPMDDKLDIEDPIGKSGEVFARVADDIETAIAGLLSWISRQPLHTTDNR